MANEVMNRRNNELMNDVNDPFFDNLADRKSTRLNSSHQI